LLESELIRLGKGQHNLSQMYVARCAYTEKAITYLRMNGNHSFDQGGEGWDIPSIVSKYGIVPESVYTGLKNGATRHDHSEMIAVLKGFMSALVKRDLGTYSENWIPAFEGILDAYLGPIPKEFTYQGKNYTPQSFAASLQLNMSDYVALTSFTHHPDYSHFVIEVPDNWAMDRAYNLPLTEFTNTVINAIDKGYTVAWAADVSEKGFSFRDGLAIVPADESTIKKIKEVLGKDYKSVPIYFLHGDLTQKEMNGLYEHPKVKAMLNFTKGEGFGRPLLEFSLTGKPILVSNWSGHIDFLKQGAVLLEGELKEVHESAADQFLLKESKWFNVNISKALIAIKDVYKNYNKYKTESFQLGKQNKQNFGLEKMTKLFDVILNKYGIYTKAQPKFQQLQLPKLKMLNK
jgi:hypothetical protein